MNPYLAVLLFTSFAALFTFFFRILKFEYAIDGGPDDDGNDFTKCYDVTPMSDFDSEKFFGKPKHMYVTHARYGGRFGVCREFYTNKYSNGSLSYNYEFNGNGKPEDGVKSYTANCTGTEDSNKKGQFSLVCYQKLDWDLDLGALEIGEYDSDYGYDEEVKEEAKEKVEEKVEEEVVEKAEGNAEEYDHKYEYPLKVTVLSTDYDEYALIHSCSEITHEDNTTSFVDNFIVLNVKESAELPEALKTKFKEYGWEENTFDTRAKCKNEGPTKEV